MQIKLRGVPLCLNRSRNGGGWSFGAATILSFSKEGTGVISKCHWPVAVLSFLSCTLNWGEVSLTSHHTCLSACISPVTSPPFV